MVFEHLLHGDALAKTNPKIALRRWFSWVDAFKAGDKNWHSWLLSFVMFGMRSGICKDYTEVPYWKNGRRKRSTEGQWQ